MLLKKKINFLQLLSLPPLVCQGWPLLSEEVQPPSGGRQNLQSTVV